MNYKTTLSGLVCFLLLGFNSISANDNPCTATEITVNTSCSFSSFSNATATNTISVPDPICAGYSGSDIWFQFTMPNYGYHTIVELSAGTMTDGGMAIYSGIDCSNLTLVSCDDNSGTGNMPRIEVEDGCMFESAGATFWVRVWENGNDNNGTFDICAYTTPTNVPAGVVACGSNLIAGNTCCNALLLGDNLNGYCGNTGSYTDDPDDITDFCAFIDNNAWLAFVASEADVEISIVSSACVFGNGIQVAILETSDCSNFNIVSNCWNAGMEASGNLVATGLTVGETYYIMVDGWAGDICDYALGIVSGVETVTVSVDDDEICGGESTQLHANVLGEGSYTYSWSPTASLDDPTSAHPIATPATSTDYTVTITGVSDNVHTVSVTVYPSAPVQPTVIGPTSVCENATGVVYTSSVANTSDYVWTVTGDATITGGNGTDTVFVDWGTTGGSVCLIAQNNCGVSPQECVSITATGQPDIDAIDPSVACAPDPFDLTTIVIFNSGSGGFPSITYHSATNDALNGTNAILPPSTTMSGRYYVRMETGPDCYDIDSVEVVIEDPALVIVDPADRCSPDVVDLDNVTINEVNGYSGGTKTYYTDSLDADAANNPLASSIVSTGGVYWVRYQTPGGCHVVGAINVNIDQTPDITVVDPAPLCPGGTIDLNDVVLNDANNATFTKYFFNNQTFAILGLNTLALTNTEVSMPQTYYLRAETANNCFQVVEISVTAGITPTGAISGIGTVCEGQDTDITFTLGGSGPFDVVYNTGGPDITLTGISDGHTEAITVSSNMTVGLVSMTDVNGCNGGVDMTPVTIISSPAPTGVISGDATICASDATPLNFTFTGTGPFDAVYSDGTDSFNLNDVPANHSINVSAAATTTYTLVSVTDASMCSGTTSGSAVITVAQPLQINNLIENCNPAFTMYTVSFEIANGDANTYNVTGGAGTLTGNVFTSDPIASGTAYSFTISDSSGCPSEMVSGNQNCACATDAGTMDLTAIEVCENETATATFNTGSNTLNPGDLARYVLHDNAGATMGTVFAFSDTPTFSWQAGITLGNTYYISPIAGPDDGSGQVDFGHVCFSIAPGTPVVFYELPVAAMSGTAIICAGESTDLTFNFTAGTGPFDVVVSSDNGPDFLIDDIINGATYTVTPATTTTYTLASVTDNTGAQCTGSVGGNATVTVLESIQVQNVTRNCDASFLTYTVRFEITGGDAANYVVTGDAGTLVGNVFTSDPIASGSAYNFIVNDGSGCPDQNVSGTFDCLCTTDAGQMDMTAIDICENEMASASFITGSNTLNTGDGFQFVLHDNPGATLGNILALSSTPAFSFQAGMTTGTTYYVSPIAGPDDGSGNVDINHLCFSINAGVPVVFYETPQATISGDATICITTATSLVFNFSAGTGPFDVTIEDQDGNPTNLTGLNDGDTHEVSPTALTTYTITGVTDSSPAICSGTGTGSATITVNDVPQVNFIEYRCNNTNTQYQVVFEITGGDPSSYAVTGDAGTLDNVTNIFVSDLIDNGTAYGFQITDGNACRIVEETGSHICDCTSNAGQMGQSQINVCEGDIVSAQHNTTILTLDGNDVLGFILYDENGTLPGSVMLTSTTPDFAYDPALSYGVTYHIAAVVADDAGTGFPVLDSNIDPCLSISNGQPVVFTQEPTVSITGDNTICQGDSTDLIFNLSGVGPFNVRFSHNGTEEVLTGISNGHTVRVGPMTTTTYTLTTVDLDITPFCAGVIDAINSTVIIDVIELPLVTNLTSTCNQAGTNFVIQFEITGGNATLYNVTGDPGTLAGNVFTSDPILGGSTYTFQVDDGSGCPPTVVTATEYCNCTPDIRPVISLEETITCSGDQDGALSVVNENGVAPFSFAWSNGGEGELLENLATGWHFVTMTDGNNCTSIDSFFLDEPMEIDATVTATTLACYGDDDGAIVFENIEGGTGDYDFSINASSSFIINTFYGLPAGAYEALVEDSDGCTWRDTIEILDPEELLLNIGENDTVEFGDSVEIIPIVSGVVDSFIWTSSTTLECPECWEQVFYPQESVIYTLTAFNSSGCMTSEQITIEVTRDRPIFVPNIFTPNGDGENDILSVYSGKGVERIKTFKVFDRWGAVVYEIQDLEPNMDYVGWDGRLKGKEVAQGVFVYFVEVIFKDGSSELIRGDVTLLR